MLKKQYLNGKWKLFYLENQKYKALDKEIKTFNELKHSNFSCIDATVPGNVEVDFEKAGLLNNIYLDTNVLETQKLEKYHFWYAVEFDLFESNNSRNLILCGVDTFADIYIDGKLIYKCDNMLIEHKIDLGKIIAGKHEIVIHIYPTVLKAMEFETNPTENASIYNFASLHVRKAPHMYGWDITPRIISAGLWRDIYIEELSPDRIDDIYIYTRSLPDDKNQCKMSMFYSTTLSNDEITNYKICVEGKCGESFFAFEKKLWFNSGTYGFTIDEPKLWNIKDKGSPNQYRAKVLLKYNNKVVAEKDVKFGVRTIELVNKPIHSDGEGEFIILLNGEKTFIRGTNWVPADALHSNDKMRIPLIMELVDDIHCNMLRCWGGNVYEDDDFFDICDEKGILVWQDFSMACGTYPQNEEFCQKLRNEAISVVRKLRQHPSIVIWAGDNECDEVVNRGWSVGIKSDPNNNVLTRKVLPEVLRTEDPFRPFLPSSPYVDKISYQTQTPHLVENHLWGPRDYYKSDFYTKSKSKFASETGYHGCVSPQSANKFLSSQYIWPPLDNDAWIVHAASPEISTDGIYNYRIKLMCNQIETLFGFVPSNLKDFAMCSQISQAESMKFFIERFRMGKWDRTGIIWWNIMDCWPQFSDAVVDYYFSKKQAYFHIKQSQQPFCIMVSEKDKDGNRDLVAVNDTNNCYNFEYKIIDAESDSIIVSGISTISQNGKIIISKLPIEQSKHGMYYIEWNIEDKKYYNHYLYGNPTFDYEKIINWFSKFDIIHAEGF